MPGVIGIISSEQFRPDVSETLERMAAPIQYNPDQNVKCFRRDWFACAMIDYGSRFPFLKSSFAQRDNVLLIMEGEVFPDAAEVPHEFADNSPTIQRAEYCLYLYLKYGTKFVKLLNGTFIIAIFDNRDRKIHLFNDRFGSKPVYIWQKENEFVFSTSLRSLLFYRDDIGQRYDKDAISELIIFERILGNKTLFHDICRLASASHAIWDGKKLHIEKYWNIFENPKAGKLNNWKDAAAEFLRLLEKSIKKRLADDAKSGAFISGGLDSRLLLALCPESTIAVTFSNKNAPASIETQLAEKIVKMLHHKHVLIERDKEHYAYVAELAVDTIESMMTFAGCHSLGLHERIMSSGIRVILTGMWWDIMFKGYNFLPHIKEYIYAYEPDELKSRRLAWHLSNSGVIRKQHHQHLLTLAFNDNMKCRAAVVKERVIEELFDSLSQGHSMESYAITNLQSDTGIAFEQSLMTRFINRSPMFDNDLFSLALNLPSTWKKDGQIVRWALKIANPKLAWISDANTGLPAGLCPPWSRILEKMQQNVRNTGKILSRYSKNVAKLRHPAAGCKIFSSNSSWHDRDGLLKFSDKYRMMIESTINQIDEAIFDKKMVLELFNNDLNAPAPRLCKLWEILLTFGLFDQKYGPNTDRSVLKKNAKVNCSITKLFD